MVMSPSMSCTNGFIESVPQKPTNVIECSGSEVERLCTTCLQFT